MTVDKATKQRVISLIEGVLDNADISSENEREDQIIDESIMALTLNFIETVVREVQKDDKSDKRGLFKKIGKTLKIIGEALIEIAEVWSGGH